jgi:hypothetical protein
MFLNYLYHWPKIPLELHQQVSHIITNEQDELDKFVGSFYAPYKLFPITGELGNWLKSNLPMKFGSCFHIHVITDDLVVHKDYMQEKYKVNYIFETGGSLVRTNFYNDNQILVESHQVSPYEWHWFDGTTYHNATNIEPGKKRIAITLGTNDVDSFDL